MSLTLTDTKPQSLDFCAGPSKVQWHMLRVEKKCCHQAMFAAKRLQVLPLQSATKKGMQTKQSFHTENQNTPVLIMHWCVQLNHPMGCLSVHNCSWNLNVSSLIQKSESNNRNMPLRMVASRVCTQTLEPRLAVMHEAQWRHRWAEDLCQLKIAHTAARAMLADQPKQPSPNRIVLTG